MSLFQILNKPFDYLLGLWTTCSRPECGNYILGMRILYQFHSSLFISPIYLKYDQETELYVFRFSCFPMRVLCFFVLCLTTLSVINNVRVAGQTLMGDTSYIVSYFDFMNVLVLNVFIYYHMYLHWIRTDILNLWANKLQTTSLRQFCSVPVWKMKLFATCICFTSLYIATVWTLTMFGLDFQGLHLVYKSSEPFTRKLFPILPWIYGTQEDHTVFRVLTIISRYYDAVYIHVTLNAFIPIYSFSMYQVASNFFNFILKNKFGCRDTLDCYMDYKELLEIMNSFYGPYIFHILGTTLAFHAVHLLDAFNTDNQTWKLNMYIYIVYLISFFGFPTKILMTGRKIKRWLSKNRNYAKISDGDLKLILYDVTNNRLGIGSFSLLKVSPAFTGTILQLLCTTSLLVVSNRK